MNTNKEFLYVGHYIDVNGLYILKIGTTNNLDRRRAEHTRNYKRTPNHPMPQNEQFQYDWFLPLSKYNTLRFEDRNREKWQNENVGDFIRNDRFVCETKPDFVEVEIRKKYLIMLD